MFYNSINLCPSLRSLIPKSNNCNSRSRRRKTEVSRKDVVEVFVITDYRSLLAEVCAVGRRQQCDPTEFDQCSNNFSFLVQSEHQTATDDLDFEHKFEYWRG